MFLRSHLESKLKVFNQYYDGKSGEIRCREVNVNLSVFLKLNFSKEKHFKINLYYSGERSFSIRRFSKDLLGCVWCYPFKGGCRSTYRRNHKEAKFL